MLEASEGALQRCPNRVMTSRTYEHYDCLMPLDHGSQKFFVLSSDLGNK